MFVVSRAIVKRIRSALRRSFDLKGRRDGPPVEIVLTPDRMAVRSRRGPIAIAYHIAGRFTPQALVVPWHVLKTCEGSGADGVTFRQEAEVGWAEWLDTGVPQTLTFAPSAADPFPPSPSTFPRCEQGLLTAIRDAVESTGEATRFALDHIRLRGSDGQIVGTDARQLFVQSGLALPWREAILVPACRLLASQEITQATDVRLGRSDGWLTVQAGPWSISLEIDQEARFPEIDALLEAHEPATRLTLSDDDAAFLATSINKLPAYGEVHHPVTIDLNGVVAIRGHAAGRDAATELVLTGSGRTGDDLRVRTNRRYLARAVALGFRCIGFGGGEKPAICRAGNRSYLWATLTAEAPASGSVRVTQVRSDERTPPRWRRDTSRVAA